MQVFGKTIHAFTGLLILCFTIPVWSHNDNAYYHGSGAVANNVSWMSGLSDNLRVSELSLPGTHQTLSFYGGDVVQTQSISLSDQLISGIRVLDIRVRQIADAFAIHHGSVYQEKFFGSGVMVPVINFLTLHPSETVFMRIKSEHTPKNNTLTFNEVFQQYKSIYNAILWHPTSDNPELGDIRGKVVILQNFNGLKAGINYNKLNIQDNYKLNSNWDLYGKWLDVKNQFINAKNGNRNTIYMNYLSGSTGSFPYFVASGHSSPGTKAPRLLTGLTIPGWSHTYPDFPNVNCLAGICSIAFEGTNVLSRRFLARGETNFTGMVMADFPGSGLINNIINLNK